MFVQMWLGERLKSKLKRHSGRDNVAHLCVPACQVSFHKGLAQVILVCRKKSDRFNEDDLEFRAFLLSQY